MAQRERLNGWIHPDVMMVLDELATAYRFRSVMPAIEMTVKQAYPDRLNHVIPGAYGVKKAKEEKENPNAPK